MSAVERLPGRRSWRRWRVTGKFSLWLYSMGISCGGGGCSYHGGDPYGAVYRLPPLWSFGWKHRPYALGQPDWWWACLRRQFPRFNHRPGPEITALGRHCGTCDPWWCCGAVGWIHMANCPEYPAVAYDPECGDGANLKVALAAVEARNINPSGTGSDAQQYDGGDGA